MIRTALRNPAESRLVHVVITIQGADTTPLLPLCSSRPLAPFRTSTCRSLCRRPRTRPVADPAHTSQQSVAASVFLRNSHRGGFIFTFFSRISSAEAPIYLKERTCSKLDRNQRLACGRGTLPVDLGSFSDSGVGLSTQRLPLPLLLLTPCLHDHPRVVVVFLIPVFTSTPKPD